MASFLRARKVKVKHAEGILQYATTALLFVSIMVLSVLLGVTGVTLTQRLIPVQRRKPHIVAIGILYGGLYVLFGVVVGFTSFLVLNKYNAARAVVENEAADTAQIYELAQQLPESKRKEIQGLAESYARVVVEKEWPLMEQGQTSPRAQALADRLRSAIQKFKPTTNTEQLIYAEELDQVDELDTDRVTRLLYMRQHLPPILWIALLGLSVNMLLFSCLVGLEDTRLHMLGVSALSVGIALVLFTIVALDRPYGTKLRIGPQPFELVLHQIKGTSKAAAVGGQASTSHTLP